MSATGRGLPWYQGIGNVLEGGTFDLKYDTGKYPTVHWLMALEMLKDYPEYEKYVNLDRYVAKIKINLQAAIDYLADQGIIVYRVVTEGSKAIEYITTDPDYRDAKKKNYDRMLNRVKRNVVSFNKRAELEAPENFNIRSETNRYRNILEKKTEDNEG